MFPKRLNTKTIIKMNSTVIGARVITDSRAIHLINIGTDKSPLRSLDIVKAQSVPKTPIIKENWSKKTEARGINQMREKITMVEKRLLKK